MKSTWIVVADSTRARIFQQEGASAPLQECEGMVHPESALHADDLVSDRQGRTFDSSGQGARHAMEPKSSVKETHAKAFARELGARLESARKRGEIDDLVLIAPPHFLGLLSAALSDVTAKLISSRLHKDLVRHSVEEIAAHLTDPG
ncbi:MAG: host attachment protein [Pseudomonadales bacterium]|nr:host attachment protein [Pseudomonadales bacterium]